MTQRITITDVRTAFNETIGVWTEVRWNQPFPARFQSGEAEREIIIWAEPYLAALMDSQLEDEARAKLAGANEHGTDEQAFKAVFAAMKEAADYAHKVRLDARDAAGKADEALQWLESGNLDRGLSYAKDAASIERKYGDAPVYGPFADLVGRYVEAERSKPKLTPEKAVKEWAKDHPGFTGLVVVYKTVKNGLFGRKGSRSSKYKIWCKEGKAAASRDDKKAGTFNGMCSVCGQVFLERVLRWAAAPDPQAGREVAVPNYIQWPGYTYITAKFADMIACPDCFGAADLVMMDAPGVSEAVDYERKIHEWRRHHPSAKHWELEPGRKLRMDLPD